MIDEVLEALEEALENIGTDDELVYELLEESEETLTLVSDEEETDMSEPIVHLKSAMNVYDPVLIADDYDLVRQHIEAAQESIGRAQEQRGEHNGRQE